VFRLTRRYRFAASHRLHAAQLSDDENRRIYGKCNHPYGHGHNYVLEVSVWGPLDEQTGCAANVRDLDDLVSRHVLAAFDDRNLNEEIAAFGRTLVPTSENLGVEICRRLKHHWRETFPEDRPKLEKVRIAETPRNIFEIEADEVK
jgi:6-pyruvoyltetrahydropterin/6-carboxytetrahydropterin synthase